MKTGSFRGPFFMGKNRGGTARRRRQYLLIIEVSFIVFFVFLMLLIAQKLIARWQIAVEEESAAALLQTIPTLQPTVVAQNAPLETISTTPGIQPEIAALLEQNSDAVGLLHFAGDRTLYVCQTTDNSFYMSHRFDRSVDPAGMIYMDYRDSLWPRSDNLVLYGHNMRDGSRFGTLRRFEQKAYLMRYPIFRLVDLYETANYVPFSIFHTTVIPDEPEYFAFDRIDFLNEEDFKNYIAEVKTRSVLRIPIEVSPGDRLLTLATCYSNLERGRLVIVCREVKDGERFE